MSAVNPGFAESMNQLADSMYNAGTTIISSIGSAVSSTVGMMADGIVAGFNAVCDIFNNPSPPPHPLQGEGTIDVVETFPTSTGTVETTIVDPSWGTGTMTPYKTNVMLYPDGTREIIGPITFPTDVSIGSDILFAKPDKSPEAYEEHLRNLGRYKETLDELQVELGKATGPKTRKPIEEKIDEIQRRIKGEQKEIEQKWGDSK